MEDILASVREHAEEMRDRITFEYVLLAGVNDSVEHAKEPRVDPLAKARLR